jgi:heme oxygenase (biliverdin-producing, ferredoxin)
VNAEVVAREGDALPPAVDLATLLRNGTRELHRVAERSGLMRRLLAGDIDREVYCRLLRSLHAIYQRLEPALERHCAAGPLSRVHLPGLSRAIALESDLDALHGDDWRDAILPTAAALSYVERLRRLDESDPPLLLAHSYVRYLGDLSGGQVLGRVIARALDLRDGCGIAFYTFGSPGAEALAIRYRHGLASIRVPVAEAARIVDEACAAFRRHCAMFEELG